MKKSNSPAKRGPAAREKTIKAILFDFGGVVATDPSLHLNQEIAKIFGINEKRLTKIYRGQNLENFERGLINADTFRKVFRGKIAQATKQEVTFKQIKIFEKTLTNQFRPYPQLIRYLKTLKKNYRIALLTNNIPIFMRIWHQRFHLKTIFPVIINSFNLGMRKPSPQIYRSACRKINHKPSECLFIDDQKKNLAGARKAGLKTILFTSEKRTIKAIKNKLKE